MNNNVTITMAKRGIDISPMKRKIKRKIERIKTWMNDNKEWVLTFGPIVINLLIILVKVLFKGLVLLIKWIVR